MGVYVDRLDNTYPGCNKLHVSMRTNQSSNFQMYLLSIYSIRRYKLIIYSGDGEL